MNKSVHELLFELSSKGFKSYIVGGYVRDLLLGFDNYDLDIVTNAPVDIILDIFIKYNPVKLKYNTIKFKYNEYDVDIAQIRSETFKNGKVIINYTNNLQEDYLRRDFTFNAIYMDQDSKIYDFDHCVNDLNSLKLKFISDPNAKCIEDPTRILRAIYFILKYGIKSYDDLISINITLDQFKNCDVNALNKCIYKILKLNKNEEFVNLLNKLNIYNYIFTKNSNNYYLKPIDFLHQFGYVYIDSIINNN
ncbi:MAG: CCA tRNA nucleotidyltransferase [Bacilli bacterium]|nr:CCA tRNA nucleotidyltransferase [Bacilli bacterium]